MIRSLEHLGKVNFWDGQSNVHCVNFIVLKSCVVFSGESPTFIDLQLVEERPLEDQKLGGDQAELIQCSCSDCVGGIGHDYCEQNLFNTSEVGPVMLPNVGVDLALILEVMEVFRKIQILQAHLEVEKTHSMEFCVLTNLVLASSAVVGEEVFWLFMSCFIPLAEYWIEVSVHILLREEDVLRVNRPRIIAPFLESEESSNDVCHYCGPDDLRLEFCSRKI